MSGGWAWWFDVRYIFVIFLLYFCYIFVETFVILLALACLLNVFKNNKIVFYLLLVANKICYILNSNIVQCNDSLALPLNLLQI